MAILGFYQNHFRIYDDDAGLNDATALKAEDENFYNFETGRNYRLRIGLTGQASSGTVVPTLYVSEDGGAYAQITTNSGNCRLALTDNFANKDATSKRLTGTGTWDNGQGLESTAAADAWSSLSGHITEYEYCIKFESGASAHRYQFKVYVGANPPASAPYVPLFANPSFTQISDIKYYDETKFSSPDIFLEATLKTSNASYSAFVRLFDKTDSVVVADSTVSSSSISLERQRSAALTLVTGHEYYLQAGIMTGYTVTVRGADLIFQQ